MVAGPGTMDLYHMCETSRSLATPALIVVLSGASDPGYAQTDAVANLLRDGNTELAASFDVDQLLDYRTQPPMQALMNGLAGKIMWPEIRAEAGRDPYGQDWVVLHGPTPAYRRRAFGEALAEIATRWRTRMGVALNAIPGPAPHTRPVRVLGSSARSEFLNKLEPHNGNVMTVAAGIEATISGALENAGIPAVTLSAQVPSYLANSPYPAASAALLDTLSLISGLGIDATKLHRTATDTRRRLDEHLAANDRYAEHVRAMERHFDATEHQRPAPLRMPTEEQISRKLRDLLREAEPDS